MHVFYAPEISTTFCLPREESYHAIRVLRLKREEVIHIIDGSGGFYEASIVTEDTLETKVKLIKEQQGFGARNYQLDVFLAPTKNMDRFEFFIEKAVEIGIDEITPLMCEHSERFKLRMDRLDRIIISAMKQSYKAKRPKLNRLTSFSSAIESVSGINGIAHCSEIPRVHIKTFLEREKINNRKKIAIFIGPEGDFSSNEIKAAENKGIIGISLGSSRLRTETAGLVACYAVNCEFGFTS